MVRLAGRDRWPSAVYRFAPDDLRTGWEAVDRGAVSPSGLDECPLRTLSRHPNSDSARDGVAAVLSAVVTEASESMGSAPQSMVVVIPAGWSADQAALLRWLGAQAGVGDTRIVRSPLASVAGAVEDLADGQSVAVLDVGAGSTSCAVVRGGPGGMDAARMVWPVGHEPGLGGDLFDQFLLGAVVERSGLTHDRMRQAANETLIGATETVGDGGSATAPLMLERTVRQAREELSATSTAVISCLPWVERLTVTREDLEAVLEEPLDRCVEVVDQTLENAGYRAADVGRLLVVGATASTPLLQHKLRERFGELADFRHEEVNLTAVGAARLASALPQRSPAEPRRRVPVVEAADEADDSEGADESSQSAAPSEARDSDPGPLRAAAVAAAAVAIVFAGVGILIGAYTVIDSMLDRQREPVVEAAAEEPDPSSAEMSPEARETGSPGEVGSEAGPGDYDVTTEDNFMEGCEEAGGATGFCECVYEEAEQRIPFERFVSIDQRVAVGGELTGTDMGWILISCREWE